jgi:hypothetical protein
MPQLTPENIKRMPYSRGVYRIWAKSENGKPISIHRFCGIDNNGLLYIGRTIDQTLSKRVYQFSASSNISKNTHNHSGAGKYKNSEIIRKTLGEHKLWFDFIETDDPKTKENELLTEYSLLYGEKPPLNK